MNEKYLKAFTETFNVTSEQAQALSYQVIPEWDSVGHMTLIAAIEEAFDIMLEMEDIIDFGSFEKGKDILKKYGVNIN